MARPATPTDAIHDDLTAAYIKLRIAQHARRFRDDAANRRRVTDAWADIDRLFDMALELGAIADEVVTE